MSKKRIIAYCMHEHEWAAANAKMSDVTATESYLLGRIEEADIQALQERGIIIEVLEEQPETETPGRAWEVLPGVERRMFVGPLETARPLPPPDLTKPNFYIIRLSGPLLEEWRQGLERLKVQLLEYLPPYSYTARLTRTQADAVRELPFVGSVRVYGPEDTGPHGPDQRGCAAAASRSATPRRADDGGL